ncbi:MAG: DUF4388 domain-containing protein [Thermoanaerobaculia bacterium]
MDSSYGSLSERSIFELVRSFHLARATGVLEIEQTGQRRRLFFRAGEIFLSGSHPLARKLAESTAALRAAGSSERDSAARQALLELVERITRVFGEWKSGKFRFLTEPASSTDLVGPLPTKRLIMLGAVLGCEEAELLQRLGGPRARLVAESSVAEGADLLGYSPEELFLLERLRQAMDLAQLLAESPIARADLLRRLTQLKAVGLVRESDSAPMAGEPGPADLELVGRFSDRIADQLRASPIDLKSEAYRQRIAELLATSGGWNHYELFGISPSAGQDDVHAAYERHARLVHPANAARLGLPGKESTLAMLFERATQAYLTLSDPERRRQYNVDQMIDAGSVEVSGTARVEEQKVTARKLFERARELAGRMEYHFAGELLTQAVKIDARPDYWILLAQIQARNPNWLRRAVDSYRAALELQPKQPEVRYALGQIYEELGEVERARVQYSGALRDDPSHAGAATRLQALLAAGKKLQQGGLLDRLFGRGRE